MGPPIVERLLQCNYGRSCMSRSTGSATINKTRGQEHKRHKKHKKFLCLLCFLCSFSFMPDSTINLLRDLIAIDSVNPSLVRGAHGEQEIAEVIAAKLLEGGLDVE